MLGKLLVPLVSTFVAYLIIAYGIPGNTINFILAPLALVWLLSYFVSCMFSEIFGMSIETILCCFIADEEMFPAGNNHLQIICLDIITPSFSNSLTRPVNITPIENVTLLTTTTTTITTMHPD